MTKWRKVLWGVVMCVLLSACGTTQTSSNTTQESKSISSSEGENEILSIGVTSAPDTLNPFYTTGQTGKFVQRFMYDSLLTQPEALSFQSGLAEPFETEDNQTFIVKIHPEANWTDGEPVTAKDVAVTINTIANPEVETSLGTSIAMLEGVDSAGKLEIGVSEVAGVKIIDDKTIEFTTKKPVDPNYISEMIGFNVLIAPAHIVESLQPSDIANSTFATNPTVTSGAYTFEKYEMNVAVSLNANSAYYRGTPQINQVTIKVLTGTNLVTELISGGVHMNAGGNVGVVPLTDIETLKQSSQLDIESYPSYVAQYMMVNNDRFDDNVRKALSYGINRAQIVEDLLAGEGEVLASNYGSASPYRSEAIEPTPFDLQQAKQYLQQSKYDASQVIELIVPTGNTLREQSANLIEQSLEEVGFTIQQIQYDGPTSLSKTKAGEYDLILMGFTFNVDPDVSNYFSTLGGSNFGQIKDEPLNTLLQEGIVATTFDERFAVYEKIQRYMQEQMFVIPLYSSHDIVVKSPNLQGGIKEFWAGSLSDLSEWTFE